MKIVAVRMLETHDGSPDGVKLYHYEAGNTYLMPSDLAAVFVREKWARKPNAVEKKTVESAARVA